MKKAYIQTYGCQMNEHDSQRMESVLAREGYQLATSPEEANLVILNTCSVRQGPENKVYSLLGRLREMKQASNEEFIIGVGGCVAQQEGKTILKRERAVDMVFGPDNFFLLPEMLEEVRSGKRVVNTKWMKREKKIQNFIPDTEVENGTVEGARAYIAITKGCDNFCTFCVVPFTRGRLVSREAENIIQEAENLVSRGTREIVLLGQNVNSYQAGDADFYHLLKSVADIPGLLRLRFTSPHPNDWTDSLSELLSEHPVICNQLHLPFQAGSDPVLQAMNRVHTRAQYLKKVDYLKKINPGVALSTDLIVGFPGETEEDFLHTLDVLRHVEFRQIYAYKYSPRPFTKAVDKLTDDVPLEVKKDRLARVFEIQDEIVARQLASEVGTEKTILVDGPDRVQQGAVCGKTEEGISTTILECPAQVGDYLRVKIVRNRAHSLEGRLEEIISENIALSEHTSMV